MKYYVDQDGKVHDTMEVIPYISAINFVDYDDHSEIQLIQEDGYIFEEYVLWDSIMELINAGVDCSSYSRES